MLSILQKSHEITPDLRGQCATAFQNLLKRSDVGFLKLPQDLQNLKNIEAFWRENKDRYRELVIVGMGGSSLGARALFQIFEDPRSQKRVHFCDNVDPHEFWRLQKRFEDLGQVLWVLVSKSGSTIETLVTADLLLQEEKKSKKKHSFCVISEPVENPLTLWANQNNVPQFPIPKDVGGRYSVLGSVGLFPLVFLGMSGQKYLSGASRALKENILVPEVMAQFLMSFDRQEWISSFWYYSSFMRHFGGWIQQLWAESLAKKTNKQGQSAPRVSIPTVAIGSSDQHSILQQAMEGARDQFMVFHRFEALETVGERLESPQFKGMDFFAGHSLGQLLAAQAQGTQRSLADQGVSTLTLSISQLDEEAVGYLFMFWQLVVAGLGEVLQVDAFDQPGVELGKRLARQILES